MYTLMKRELQIPGRRTIILLVLTPYSMVFNISSVITMGIYISKRGESKNMYIARQPIFNYQNKVDAYELLYRTSNKNAYDSCVDGTQATKEILSESVLNYGMNTLTGGKKGFINFTESLLLDNTPALFDPQQFVIEILEDVKLNPPMLRRLTKYREMGFTLALDDYDGSYLNEKVLKPIHIVKLDYRLTAQKDRKTICSFLHRCNKRILAEKIETAEEHQEALNLGCELFQGYYFANPIIIHKKRRDIAAITAARLTLAMSHRELDLDELCEIIRTDAHLTYKLLKKMHTAEYYRGYPVVTVKSALVRMGFHEIRRWALTVLLRGVTVGNVDETIKTALIRAVFCENLASLLGAPNLCEDAFAVGIFSILNNEDPEFPSLLEELNISEQIRAGLSDKGTPLGYFLKLALSYEKGNWEEIDTTLSHQLSAKLPQLYLSSIAYANRALRDI